MKKLAYSKGSALIYFAIILLLGSLVAFNFTKYYIPNRDTEMIQKTTNEMQQIEKALIEFVSNNNRLPCPAAVRISINDNNFGIEARNQTTFECNQNSLISNDGIYMGIVPIVSLGLDKKIVVDSWGADLEYVVPQYLVVSNSERPINNYSNTNGNLIIKTADNRNINSDTAYIILSRGVDQGGAWISNSNKRAAFPPPGNISRDNLECEINGPCGSSYLDKEFRVTGPGNDDILLYGNKDKIQSQCQNNTANTKCNNTNCTEDVWINGPVTICSTNLPSYTFSTNMLQNIMRYHMSLDLKALNVNNGSIYLNYEYKTTIDPTINTIQIALFSNKDGFVGQHNALYTGSNITIPFGDSNHIPQRLYFSMSSNAAEGSINVQNLKVKMEPLYAINALNYNIWRDLSCGAGPLCLDDSYKNTGNDKFDKYIKDLDCDNNNGYGQCKEEVRNTKNPPSTILKLDQQGNVELDIQLCTINTLLNDSRYPQTPSYNLQIPIAQGYSGYGTGYGSSIVGYFTPDQTAMYTFYIACNKEAILNFSPDSNPSNAIQVASRTQASAPLNWSALGATVYGPVQLKGGTSYYFSLLHTSPGAGESISFIDNLALGCNKTDSTQSTTIDILGRYSSNTGCPGIISTAPLLNAAQQTKCN